MRLLLDTHALIWWLAGDEALSMRARAAIGDPANDIFVSAVSAMEIATKFRLGKLPQAELLVTDFATILDTQSFAELPLSAHHVILAGGLAIDHRDPFDRMLIAQSQAEQLPLVSNEALFDGFGVTRLW